MNVYRIVSYDANGNRFERQWHADDADHAREQHTDSFPDETVRLTFENVKIVLPANLNTDDPREIVRWIYKVTPEAVDYRFEGYGDGACWIADDGHWQFAIGIDPIDGGGLCWASYKFCGDLDPNGAKVYEHWESGGWAYHDPHTARKEIADAARLFDASLELSDA